MSADSYFSFLFEVFELLYYFYTRLCKQILHGKNSSPADEELGGSQGALGETFPAEGFMSQGDTVGTRLGGDTVDAKHLALTCDLDGERVGGIRLVDAPMLVTAALGDDVVGELCRCAAGLV